MRLTPHNILSLDSIQNIFYSVDSIALTNEIMHPQIILTINSYSIAIYWNSGSFATSVHICEKKNTLRTWDELDMILTTNAHILWLFICMKFNLDQPSFQK